MRTEGAGLSRGLQVRRGLALAGLAAVTLLQFHLILSAPAPLMWLLLGAAALCVMCAAILPWRWTLALVAVWPLLVDVRRTLDLALMPFPALEPWRSAVDALPPYPMLTLALWCSGLLWAWRALLGDRERDPWPRDVLGRLTWLWGFVLTAGTLTGLAALNPIHSQTLWHTMTSDRWAWPMLSDLASLHPIAAWHAAVGGLLAFAMIRAQTANPERRRALTIALLTGAVIVSVVAVIQFVSPRAMESTIGNPIWRENRHATGLLRTPSSCGTFLLCAVLLALPIPLAGLRARVTRLKLGTSVLVLVLLAGALLTTGSRAAWFGALVLIPAWLAHRWIGARRAEGASVAPGRVPHMAMILAGIWFALMLIPSRPFTQVNEANLFHRGLGDALVWIGGDSDAELGEAPADRRDRWATAWSMIQERPWWGQGLGTFRLLSDSRTPAGASPMRQSAHSQLLQTWAETGAVGLITLLAMVLLPLTNPLGAPGAALALLGFLLTSLTGHPLALPELQFAMWILVALGFPRDAIPSSGESPQEDPRRVSHTHRRIAWIWPAMATFTVTASLLGAGLAVNRSRQAPPRYGIHEIFVRGADGVPSVWTSREAAITEAVERPFLMLPVRCGHPDIAGDEDHAVTAVIRIGTDEVLREVLRDGDWRLWVLDLRPWIGQTVTLEIEASRTWSPATEGSPDHRSLALALGPWEWLDAVLEPDPPNRRPWPLPDLR